MRAPSPKSCWKSRWPASPPSATACCAFPSSPASLPTASSRRSPWTSPCPPIRSSSIDSPADLRTLDRDQLQTLASELRAFLIDSFSRTGGHLSSNLGTVELTIALHHVFNTPDDRIVWDVGHQTYGHKVLTGRREAMAGLRQFGGISGFPPRSESEYDTFGTAHRSEERRV